MSEQKTIVYSRDGEIFQEDEGLIDDAREDWIAGEPEYGGYYSGERRDIVVEDLVSDIVVEEILNGMDEALYDIVGEAAEDALYISDEKKEELRNIITNFISENCSCRCWAVDDVKYHNFNNETNDVNKIK